MPAMNSPITPTLLLVTPREAARMLSVSPRHLWSLTQAGVVPCVKLGRSVRYDIASLQRAIEAAKAGPINES